MLHVGRDLAVDKPIIEQFVNAEQLEIVAVLNCFDTSVYYSDGLANHFLNLQLNLELSRKRSDKYEVNQLLAQAGLPIIKSVVIDPLSDLEQVKAANLNFPLIIKPASDSVARNDVVIVNSFQQLEQKLARLCELLKLIQKLAVHAACAHG